MLSRSDRVEVLVNITMKVFAPSDPRTRVTPRLDPTEDWAAQLNLLAGDQPYSEGRCLSRTLNVGPASILTVVLGEIS